MKRLLPVFLVVSTGLAACAVAPQPTTTRSQEAGTGTTCTYRATSRAAKPVDPPSGTDVPTSGTAQVVLHTSGGPITVTVDRGAAPCTAHSFESLARQGYFDQTSCHRLGTVPGAQFVQCGDPTGTGTGGPGYWFDDELAKTTGYPRGTVAMANSGPDTNGSQFFVLYGDSGFPRNYTAFGTVDAAGLAVLEKAAAGGTDDAEAPGVGHPRTPLQITSASLG